MPYQVPPTGDWFIWLLMAGRGTGKTDAMANYVNDHVNGPPCDRGVAGGHRIGIIAPTLGDAVGACVSGPTGLKRHNPDVHLAHGIGGVHVLWPNGTEGHLFSADDERSVDRLRAGGNRCLDWWEEFAAWPKIEQAYDQALFGLRIGQHPHIVASTTPRPKKKLSEIMAEPTTVTVRASTRDNPHLAPEVRERYESKYQGTRIGRQELDAELLTDTPGALWTVDLLDKHRVASYPDQARVVVAVDPSGGHGEDNDWQGIVVAGKGVDGRGYVLADRTCKLSPDGWGKRAVWAYVEFKADRLVYEQNFGGEMVEAVIRTAAQAMGVTVATKAVHASRGKAVRAEPIAALYEQGRISHVGNFPELEDELCTWTPDSGQSPNRLDGAVWGFTELMLEGAEVRFY